MSGVFSKISKFTQTYPVVRGMITYAMIWPTSSLIQQSIEGKTFDEYDWWRCARFGLFGSCYVAPTLYSWVRVATLMWPGNDLRSALTKALVESISYTPLAMISFYFGMSLLEGKALNVAIAEVDAKFLATYKVGVCVWPTVATLNFYFVPEKNRVPVLSVCSLLWTCFLAYMKHLEQHAVKESSTVIPLISK